ncbi:S-layer homology domain-containing protein [Colidextribacter sp. OB.20]|uniref:Ig-like domain-containing protein n=1 Tax=Colidextribacter sp. OB.20 TaxID=2304568 RepID=UPI00136C847F|nr:Ig-like domain-containing protein [Colidextribacter sp. OB.20]NBI09074.1 S-layer homology domain-containing protein [Colidextribacter sp. OB.20]
MKRSASLRRGLAPMLILALALAMSLPASAFFWNKKADDPYVADFSKNGLIGSVITFDLADFNVMPDSKTALSGITIDTLPAPGAGTLCVGDQVVQPGAYVDATALSGLRFQSTQAPTVTTAAMTFTPTFSSGESERQTTVTLHLLTRENTPPVARNMELTTYKNVAVTGYFDAVDSEGDALTYQLTSTPARGAVTLEEGGQFVYTPYENKTGKDSFTYVAVDPAGNTSPEARVSLRIDKPDTKVTYADLEGHPAGKAAIRLAEQGVYVGRYVNGRYFFDPDQSVTRAQFLTMAMSVAGLEDLEGISLTGFSDDEAIPTWAKGAVSAALKAGVVQGFKDESGAPVFGAGDSISRAEAAVMLDNLLDITDVPVAVFAPDSGHWAAQAAANLSASGILRAETAGAVQLADSLTMADAAQMLDGAMDVMNTRSGRGWLPWA